jgi:thioredoxin-like negative regulator of GroEL
MTTADARGGERREDAEPPALLFLGQTRSGPSRKMESLVAWVKVTRRNRLRVIQVDADVNQALVRRLGVSTLPALVLVKHRRILGRLEGRATGREIDELIRPHV